MKHVLIILTLTGALAGCEPFAPQTGNNDATQAVVPPVEPPVEPDVEPTVPGQEQEQEQHQAAG